MRYPRPVPLIGDRTSAHERAADPAAWAFPPEQRDAAHAVMAARRDIRRFRPDPVPPEVLRRVLEAGHTAPSVGHSQPWRFLVVRDDALRDRAALLAEEQKIEQAAGMEPDAARRLLDLKLDGIRDAPLGVVVCCDRRTAAAGVLGRATFPDADLWSCAAAVQNIWLAARAEGLGLGWVTLFRPQDLAGLVGLPHGVVTLGWLCLGWPDERPPEPGLERRGWSKRLPLDEVVLTDRWPAEDEDAAVRVAPPPPSHLRAPGSPAVVAARDAGDELLAAPEALGLLDRAVDRVLAVTSGTDPGAAASRGDGDASGLVRAGAGGAAAVLPVSGPAGAAARPIPAPARPGQAASRTDRQAPGPGGGGTGPGGGTPRATAGRLLFVGADHPVAARGVSAYPAHVTRDVLTAAVAGRSLGVTAARAAGLDAVVVDAGVDGGPVPGAVDARPGGARGDLVTADALTAADCAALREHGRELGRSAAEGGGPVVLGEVGVGNTTPAAALSAALLGSGPEAVVGLGSGADAAMLERKHEVVAAASGRLPPGAGPWTVLRTAGGPEFAVLAGAVLGAAEAGATVVLDGLATSVAALAAVRAEPGAAAHLIAGQRSRERAHGPVLAALGLEPLLDLRLRAGEGVGGCLAAGLLRDAVRLRAEAARVRL